MSIAPTTTVTTSAQAASRTARRVRRSLAISVGVADVRREPNGAAELVTQALLGVAATPLEESATGWVRVRLSDYEGWVAADHLAAPARRSPRVAVVTATRTPLYASSRGEVTLGEVFASAALPLSPGNEKRERSGRVRVALPGGRGAWIASGDVAAQPVAEPYPLRGPEVALDVARSLLDTPYHWGGVTALGIDCSGLTQLAYRLGGVIIPRDADQQYEGIPWIVERADVRLGDLVYFAHDGHVTHVGIAVDNMTLLHASGYGERVIFTSLDPSAGEYSARLAGMYAGARRPFAQQGASR